VKAHISVYDDAREQELLLSEPPDLFAMTLRHGGVKV
jgi:hypothetical protein